MRDDNGLDDDMDGYGELAGNPAISRDELAALHEAAWGWALSRSDYVPHVAEDLMQQAYVEIMSGSARYDGRASLKTFLFGVIHNLARSRYRRIRSRLRLLTSYAAEQQAAPAVVQAPSGSGHEDSEAVWQAVAALPARQRDVIELVFLRELTVTEAADVIGVSHGTARVHYDRAKKALAVALAGRGLDRDAQDLATWRKS